jgi:hypothetical protein
MYASHTEYKKIIPDDLYINTIHPSITLLTPPPPN